MNIPNAKYFNARPNVIRIVPGTKGFHALFSTPNIGDVA